MEESSDSSIRS